MKNKVYTVSTSDLVTIINILTYEDYARLYRALHRAGLCRRPYFSEYMQEVYKHYDLDSIDIKAWHDGYDFIADLFDDNELSGTPCDEEAVFNRQIEETLIMFRRR